MINQLENLFKIFKDMKNKKLLTEEINKMLHLMNHKLGTPRLNEDVLGKSKPIKLSDVPSKDAAIAVATSGRADQSDKDDLVTANTKATAPVGELYPMQKEVIPDKALSFALGFLRDGKPDLNNMEAIVSTGDDKKYIMDGHHRWAAATLINPNQKVGISTIDMPAADVVSALNIYTAAKGLKGNPGKGDVTQFASSIPKLLNQVRKEGNSGFHAKAKWPKIEASEVDTILGKVPGANGDANKGIQIMIANAQKLNTEKHPQAPDRVDMPVIDAAKGDLTKVIKMIGKGVMDIKPPYSKSTKSVGSQF
jgi:hypothetical protein